MKDRIQKYIDYKNISPGELAATLQVQRSNISHILNGRNKPGAALIEKLLVSFPDLNARWLMTGEGSMVSDGTVPEYSPKPAEEEVTENTEEEVKKVISHNTKSERNQPREVKIEKVILIYNDGTFKDFSYNKHT